MATGTSENGSEECLDNKCSLCIQKGIKEEATKYCVECENYYCTSCSDMHMYFPALKGHTLLDECHCNAMPYPSMTTEACSSHKDKHLEIYCEDHDEVVCMMCVAINHRQV